MPVWKSVRHLVQEPWWWEVSGGFERNSASRVQVNKKESHRNTDYVHLVHPRRIRQRPIRNGFERCSEESSGILVKASDVLRLRHISLGPRSHSGVSYENYMTWARRFEEILFYLFDSYMQSLICKILGGYLYIWWMSKKLGAMFYKLYALSKT